MTTLASGLPLILAAIRLSFQPYGSSTEYQPVAESARYFLLTAMEAEVLLALLAACLLGDAVAGISWLLLAVLPLSSLPSTVSLVNPMMHSVGAGTLAFGNISSLDLYLLLALLTGNLDDHLRRPLESEA